MEMDKTMWWSIPQSERNDQLRASSNPLWSKPITTACLWCIHITFTSRTLTKSEQKYIQIEKEAFSIVWGSRSFVYICLGTRSPCLQITSQFSINFSSREMHSCCHCSSTSTLYLVPSRLWLYNWIQECYKFTVMQMVFPISPWNRNLKKWRSGRPGGGLQFDAVQSTDSHCGQRQASNTERSCLGSSVWNDQ